jgi:hypothetical protein
MIWPIFLNCPGARLEKNDSEANYKSWEFLQNPWFLWEKGWW